MQQTVTAHMVHMVLLLKDTILTKRQLAVLSITNIYRQLQRQDGLVELTTVLPSTHLEMLAKTM